MKSPVRALRQFALWLGVAGLLLGCGGGDAPMLESPLSAPTVHALAAAGQASVAAPAVVALTKVSETRVDRTRFDYVFKVTVQNGDQALNQVVATLLGVGAGTSIIDGSATIGNMAANVIATSTDSITLRHDRTLPFQLALLSWQVTGTPPTAVPASLQISPAQWVIGAGNPLTMTFKVLDSSGQVIEPAPTVNLQLAAVADSTAGTLPTVAGGQINTSADTRGNYRVTGTVSGSTVSAQFGFAVIQNNTQSKNSGLYVALSGALASTERNLGLITAAVQSNDSAAAQAAVTAMTTAAAAIDPHRLYLSTAYEPDIGFVPPATKLLGNGFTPIAGDAGYAAATNLLRGKLQQITNLLDHPSADVAANNAQIAQFLGELQSIAATLKTAAATPGVYGVVNSADGVGDLLAKDVPALMKAIAARTAAEVLAGNGANIRQRASAATAAKTQPAQFGIGSLLNALGPMGQLINKIYGDYLQQLQNMVIILGAKDLLDKFVTQNIQVAGVKAGAALLGPYAYHYPDSYIELSTSTSVAAAQGADVYLIGGAAVNALGSLFGSIKPPSNPKNIKEIYDYFDSLIDAIKGVGAAYDQAHQQPTSVTAEGFFETFGCLPSLSDSCVQLNYANGFENVSGGSVSFTVLILVRTGGPKPQVGSLVVNFAPGT